MIWVNNTNEFVVIYLDVLVNFHPLAKVNLHHLIFVTALFLVWTVGVGHMDPYNSFGK